MTPLTAKNLICYMAPVQELNDKWNILVLNLFQAAKICNNLLLAVSMIGVSEASNLAIRLGLEPEMIAKVINSSSGRCWSSDTYNPCPGIIEGIPSSNNYQGGFASQLMAKVSQSMV